eukprot:TRINITY_DN3277_c0_g1_i1.p1 TRINITY_DN3277_c0_g1~~TRINITY_DN3277_c0_g1_i1.p1  ORF type:complete len:356 (-),score=50.16 TRINITY_DN3277_c0_g1_i1:148-1161(-)
MSDAFLRRGRVLLSSSTSEVHTVTANMDQLGIFPSAVPKTNRPRATSSAGPQRTTVAIEENEPTGFFVSEPSFDASDLAGPNPLGVVVSAQKARPRSGTTGTPAARRPSASPRPEQPEHRRPLNSGRRGSATPPPAVPLNEALVAPHERCTSEVLEDLQHRLNGMVANQVVTTEFEKPPIDALKNDYRRQGNVGLYTKSFLRRRAALFTSKEVEAAARRLWVRIPGTSDNTMNQRSYNWWYRKLYFKMVPEGSDDECDKLATEEWGQESKGKPFMEFADFYESIFTFVDIWCEDEDYAGYIDRVCMPLLKDVTLQQPFHLGTNANTRRLSTLAEPKM